jgi:serine phosphatase RsbU (regulator of sigma subunit)
VEAGQFVDASRRTFRRGDALPGRVWERGRAEWVADFGAETGFSRREAAAASGLRAAFAFPVMAGHRMLGVIELMSRKPRDASPELFSRLALLGAELGYFVERRTIEEERLAAHDALRLQTALLQTQSESGLEGQLLVSPEGEVVSLNRRFAQMWGLSDDFLERGSAPEALALAAQWLTDPDAFLAGTRQAQARRQMVRDEIVLRDGRVFDRYGAPLIADGGYLGYAWYFRDVTDQKRVERELARAGERSASLARTLQQSLLPPELPSVRGLDVAARYHPAGAGLDVGGDFYDVFRTRRGSVGIAIGDVCGKGAPAASLTALVRYTLRTAAMQTRSPAQALSIVNAAMIRQQPEEGAGKFATVAYAALQRSRGVNTLTVSSGGHPLPLVRRRDGTVEPAARPGTLLGLFPTVQLHDHSIELESGDAVVFFTDGVIEARAGADFFGEERVRAILGHTVGWSAADIVAAIETAAFAFQGGDTGDDIAVLAVALR